MPCHELNDDAWCDEHLDADHEEGPAVTVNYDAVPTARPLTTVVVPRARMMAKEPDDQMPF